MTERPEVNEWFTDGVGEPAVAELDAWLADRGLAPLSLPSGFATALHSGKYGDQWVTDPKPGTPYMCKSYWDDVQPPSQLFSSLHRLNRYLLIGTGYRSKDHLNAVLRTGPIALLLDAEDAPKAQRIVPVLNEFMKTYDNIVTPLRYWVWIAPYTFIVAVRDDPDGSAIASPIESPGWRSLIKIGDACTDTSRESLEWLATMTRPNGEAAHDPVLAQALTAVQYILSADLAATAVADATLLVIQPNGASESVIVPLDKVHHCLQEIIPGPIASEDLDHFGVLCWSSPSLQFLPEDNLAASFVRLIGNGTIGPPLTGPVVMTGPATPHGQASGLTEGQIQAVLSTLEQRPKARP